MSYKLTTGTRSVLNPGLLASQCPVGSFSSTGAPL